MARLIIHDVVFSYTNTATVIAGSGGRTVKHPATLPSGIRVVFVAEILRVRNSVNIIKLGKETRRETVGKERDCSQSRIRVEQAFLFPFSPFKLMIIARCEVEGEGGWGRGVECPGYVVWGWGKQVFSHNIVEGL